MNFKQSLLTATAAATTLIGLVSAPAQAFSFGNNGISFDKDTIVDFSFKESHGYFWGQLGVLGPNGTKTYLGMKEDKPFGSGLSGSDNGSAGEYKGTCGNTVSVCADSFTFKAGERYSLFLESKGAAGRVNTMVYSTTALNTGSQTVNGTPYAFGQQVKFFDDLSLLNDSLISSNRSTQSKLVTTTGLTNADPYAKEILLAWEDQGIGVHTDYNDFLVTAKARSVDVPEPTTLGGIGLVAGALGLSRARRRKVA